MRSGGDSYVVSYFLKGVGLVIFCLDRSLATWARGNIRKHGKMEHVGIGLQWSRILIFPLLYL
jgi:hypothetical protein